MSKTNLTGPQRIAAERKLAAERNVTFPAVALGLPPTATSNLHQMKIAPPTLPAPGPRVAPPRSPHQARMVRRSPSPAALRAAIDDHLSRIKHGDRQLVAEVVEQYSQLASQAEAGPELAALRRRVLSAAFGADIGEVAAAKKSGGPITRRVV